MMNMGGCNQNIAVEASLRAFMKEIVPALNMTAVGEPLLYAFDDGQGASGKSGGYSVLQMITTSNIALHGDNFNGSMYVDVFSCKPFDVNVAIEVAVRYFAPKKYTHKFLYRDSPTAETGDQYAVVAPPSP
jgi:S-adenosylmethionine/arginine decarboxylase-like enzyme